MGLIMFVITYYHPMAALCPSLPLLFFLSANVTDYHVKKTLYSLQAWSVIREIITLQ